MQVVDQEPSQNLSKAMCLQAYCPSIEFRFIGFAAGWLLQSKVLNY
jgi:hypothetical protein